MILRTISIGIAIGLITMLGVGCGNTDITEAPKEVETAKVEEGVKVDKIEETKNYTDASKPIDRQEGETTWHLMFTNPERSKVVIKEKAEETMGNNYVLIKTYIEEQEKAYNKIVSNLDTMDKDILEEGCNTMGADFVLIQTYYDEQMKAKKELYGE